MIQLASWAHAAYEAARRRDRDGVAGVIGEVVQEGPEAIEYVSRCWIDRTLTVLNHCTDLDDPSKIKLRVGGNQHGDPLPEMRWVGQLVVARLTENARMWDHAWAVAGDDPVVLGDLLAALVAVMSSTAQDYHETAPPLPRECCLSHRVAARISPMGVGDRAAVAYLN